MIIIFLKKLLQSIEPIKKILYFHNSPKQKYISNIYHHKYSKIMANFVISSVVSSFNSTKSSIINTLKNNPIYSTFNEEESWKKDNISSRLSDLTVQKSAYNNVIPTIYGTSRLAGNIIWATNIKEVQNAYTTSYSTGKGGKKINQNVIDYYYYANIAIGICSGSINEIKRVWADTDLIDINRFTYRLYNGTEYQSPDPLIQSIQGIGKTPAYRGLAYIVFENLPLAEFGNRIPNFTFEVTRNSITEGEVENLISGVNIIPGCGEFVYDTSIVSKENGVIWYNKWHPTGEITRINQNNNNGVSDAVLSTKQLKETLPNCKWVAPVVVWFGNSTNIANCTIEPRVEFKVNPAFNTQITTPQDWSVAGLTRSDANLISFDNNTARYGGTVSDYSLVRYLSHLKSQGYKIMFYPMIFLDLPNKPWRGYLTGDIEYVNDFFTKSNGYNNFILHYANLVKDYVDCFIIGSEFRDLTKITDGNGNFPAVDCLINLAGMVRNIVGSDVKISYAADWSEYHHTDGGWYNMDKLWASQNIDFIGIDAYFPLTNKKESLITLQDIKDGWTSGEGYDYFYEDKNRTIKIDAEPRFAWKNIEWWWSNQHINPNGQTTSWAPKSKKIWFTEYGFASVDGTTNEPNKFYDPKSIDGGFPRFSEGKIDYYAQKKAIQATEEKWANSPMVEQKFLWCWDARPYPFFPKKLDIWSDGGVWYYGHWLNGKVATPMFSNIIKTLFKDVEINTEVIGDINIYDSIDGIVFNNIVSVNQVLNILQKIFFFDYYEKDGKLQITSKKTESSLQISENELVAISNGVYFKTNMIGESELPYKSEISYINKELNYEPCNSYFERTSINSSLKESDTIPAVISSSKANQIAEKLLYSIWLERTVYEFRLPPKYIFLNVADVIALNINNINLILRIQNITINTNNTIDIKAVKCDNSLYSFKKEEENFDDIDIILPTSKTNFEIFELPAIKTQELPEVFFATYGSEKGWNGCAIYNAKTGSYNYKLLNENRNNSIVGNCLNILQNARPYYLDKSSELYVSFNNNMNLDSLESVDLFDFLDGENLALVGNEIIQFKNIELKDNGSYKVYNLLRGQYGTEKYMSNHIDNEKFIYLNKGLISNTFNINNIGISYNFKSITFKDSFDNSTDKTFVIEGKNLKTINPVHIKKNKVSNGYNISWNCILKGSNIWKDGKEEIDDKKFQIIIYNENNNIIRTQEILNTFNFLYTNEMLLEDFPEYIPNNLINFQITVKDI